MRQTAPPYVQVSAAKAFLALPTEEVGDALDLEIRSLLEADRSDAQGS